MGEGLLPVDRTNVIKLLASYNWDLGPGRFTAGFSWVYQTGTPLSLFDDGSTSHGAAPGYDSANETPYHTYDIGGYGNAVPANFQLGQYGRTPSTNLVDVKFDYSWKISPKMFLAPSMEISNLFNCRQATRFLEAATDDNGLKDERYGQATDWMRGRRVRFGLKLTF